VTGKALFLFDRAKQRFRLESVHSGVSIDDITANTGFDFDRPAQVPVTPAPDATTLAQIRGPIGREIAEAYPQFAADILGIRTAA